MKIGIVTDELSIGSGIGRYVHELINGLEENGISVEKISVKKPRVWWGDPVNHMIKLPYLVLRNKDRFDLIHATTPVTGLSFPLVKGKPKVVTYHDLVSLLSEVSGTGFHVRATAKLFLNVGKFSDRIITVSSQTKEELVEYMKFPEEKISVINLGVDERFRPLNKKKNKEEYIIGYLGDLNVRKRIDHLIKAFKHLRTMHPELKVKLHIYGRGSDFHRLKSIADALRLGDSVEFKGFAPEEKLVEIYNSFDVFVLPSEWEGFGIPILEAQRCGVPVIVRQDAHIPQEVSKYCITARSERDMAEKMYELLVNTNLREEIVKKGLEYSKKFTWERTVKETIKIYESLMSR